MTSRGQLVKIFSTFQFQDGFTYSAAIYSPGQGWTAVRYKPDGQCSVDSEKNHILNYEIVERYANYMQFVVWFDRATNKWRGRATDPRGTTIVELLEIEHRERAMQLIQLGVEQKVLSWMREAGYDEETKEVVGA